MPKRLEFGLVALALLILFGALTVFFWDFVRSTIVLPLYYMIWVGGLVLNSIPQEAFLALLVVVSFGIGVDALLRGQRTPIDGRGDSHSPRGETRYREWLKRCRGSFSSELARRGLAAEVSQLVLSVLAFQEGIDLAEAERSVADHTLLMPEKVRYLIVSKEFRGQEPYPNRTSRAISRLGWRFKPTPSNTEILDEQIGEILQFLESRLEMTHE